MLQLNKVIEDAKAKYISSNKKASSVTGSLNNQRSIDYLAVFSTIFGMVCLGYLVWVILVNQHLDVDFKYIWLSGHLWGIGASPYGHAYVQQGQLLFDDFNNNPFFYPPNWWMISTFLSMFEYHTALNIWRWFNLSLIVLSSLTLRAGMANAGVNITWASMMLYTGLVALMQSTFRALILGQTSILIYFGFCVLIYGVISKKNSWAAVGFCLLLLKPHIGLVFMAALLVFHEHHRSLLFAVSITFLMALPSLLFPDPVNMINEYLVGLSMYGNDIYNMHNNISGLSNIIYRLTKIEIPSMAISIGALWFTFGVAMIINGQEFSGKNWRRNKSVAALVMGASMAGIFIPMHLNDLLFISPVILLTVMFAGEFQLLFLVPFLMVTRAYDLAWMAEKIIGQKGGVYIDWITVVNLAFAVMLLLVIMLIRSNVSKSK
ncbi:MAG: glycosyltransferase family 87 protein [Candidatus Sedimenticola sp. (ex Thyasira tokunagai)]